MARHVMAFARVAGDEAAIVAVPRLMARVERDGVLPRAYRWDEMALHLGDLTPRGPYRNRFTGDLVEPDAQGRVFVSDLLGAFPVAMLVTT
jgi:maltooligosyltrehalose synthase